MYMHMTPKTISRRLLCVRLLLPWLLRTVRERENSESPLVLAALALWLRAALTWMCGSDLGVVGWWSGWWGLGLDLVEF